MRRLNPRLHAVLALFLALVCAATVVVAVPPKAPAATSASGILGSESSRLDKRAPGDTYRQAATW